MESQKTALVTGASRGIGRAIAKRLAHDGFDIIGTCSRNIEALEETRKEVEAAGRTFTPLAFDIADREASAHALAKTFGDDAPDVIVFNAGISRDDLFVFMSPDKWDSVIHTNVDGFYNVVQPLIMPMMGRRSGRIVVISSASGQTGQAGQVNYSASKAALIGAVKALAREVGRKKILVNAVAPGFIETDMTADIPKDKVLPLIPLNRAGLPDEVAGAVSFLCGPDSTYIQGQVLPVNGGLVI